MKTICKTLLAIAFLIITYTANAQDVMIFRNGDEVNVKVSEVGVDFIKYKRSDNPEGPSYEARKNDVFMVKYANGAKDVFNNPTPPPSSTIGNTAPSNLDKFKPIQSDYDKYMRTYQRRHLSGTICTSIGVPFVVLGLSLVAGGMVANERYNNYQQYNNSYYNYYGDGGTGSLIAGSIFLGAGVPLSIIGAVQLGTSNKYLRKALESRPTLSFAPNMEPIKPVGNIGGSQMGFAMRLAF